MSSVVSLYTGTRENGTDLSSPMISSSVRESLHANMSTRGVMTSHAVSSSRRKARSTNRYSSSPTSPSSCPNWVSSRTSRSSWLDPSAPSVRITPAASLRRGLVRPASHFSTARTAGAAPRANRIWCREARSRGRPCPNIKTAREPARSPHPPPASPPSVCPRRTTVPTATVLKSVLKKSSAPWVCSARILSSARAFAP